MIYRVKVLTSDCPVLRLLTVHPLQKKLDEIRRDAAQDITVDNWCCSCRAYQSCLISRYVLSLCMPTSNRCFSRMASFKRKLAEVCKSNQDSYLRWLLAERFFPPGMVRQQMNFFVAPCRCERKGNTYTVSSTDSCTSFTQSTSGHPDRKLDCPAGLRFNTRVCVCDHPDVTDCSNSCTGPTGQPASPLTAQATQSK